MPEKVSQHPAVQEASTRLSELRRRKSELESEFQEARFGSREPSVDDMAEEVYAGGSVTATDTRAASEVQRELKATSRAIQRARTELSRARNEAREAVLEEIRPRYRTVVARMARHARALLDASEDELALEGELKKAGLKPLADPAVIRLPEGTLRKWLEKAEEKYDV